MSGATNERGGRRAAPRSTRRRPSPLVVVGVATIAVAMGALALQAEPATAPDAGIREPETAPLHSLDLSCPSGTGPVRVARLGTPAEESQPGEVTVRVGDAKESSVLPVTPEATATVSSSSLVALHGAQSGARGLTAARDVAKPALAAAECSSPAGEQWFVGAGAGGLRSSVLTLSNPDARAAVADLEVYSTEGPITSALVRGISVAGNSVTRLDLAEVVPQREEIAVRVLPRQGRLVPSVRDLAGSGRAARIDWLPSAAAPSEVLQIPAVPGRSERNVLVLVNPGDSAGRAKVTVTGASSESAPVGLREISVPAGAVVSVDLTKRIAALVEAGDTVLTVRGTVPLAGSLRAEVDGDLVHLAAVGNVEQESGQIVPSAQRRLLVLSAAERAGAVTVHFVGGDVWEGRLRPGQSTRVPVPAGASALWVETKVAHFGAIRAAGSRGTAWLPLRPLANDRLVPSVRPAR